VLRGVESVLQAAVVLGISADAELGNIVQAIQDKCLHHARQIRCGQVPFIIGTLRRWKLDVHTFNQYVAAWMR
jgi:hypothetical protein